MNKEDLVPKKWKSQIEDEYKDEAWSLYAENITRHP